MNEDEQKAIEQERIRLENIRSSLNKARQGTLKAVENFEKRNRVTVTTMVSMILVAALYDLAQAGFDLIPIAGWIFSSILGIYAWLTFYVWTSAKGWGGTDTLKKWIVNILRALGVIPLINIGPEVTAGVVLSILIVKSDDFLYNVTKGKADIEKIRQGLAFFNLFRDVTKN